MPLFSGLVEIDDYYIDPNTYIAEYEGTPRCLSAALMYAGMGWSVFPAPRGTKKSHKAEAYSNGRPWGKTKDPNEIRSDYKKWPEANVALPCGEESGFFVIDTESVEGHGVDGEASLRALEQQHGALPITLMSVGATGGKHRFYKWPKGYMIRNSTCRLGPGIDVKGEGGMVIAPPSVRDDDECKGSYVWVCNVPLAEAPAWLIELAKEPEREEVQSETEWPPYDDFERERLCCALPVIPSHDRDIRINVGMALKGYAGKAGRSLWDEWLANCPEELPNKDKTWASLHPRNEITIGSVYYLADEADISWRDRYDAEMEARLDAAANNPEADRRMMEELGIHVVDIAVEVPGKTEQPAPAQTKQQQPEPIKPLDLWANFPAPKLVMGMLPPEIEIFARKQGRLMGADPAGIAMAALAVCAAAIPDKIMLTGKKHSDFWYECTRLWIWLIGGVSAKKSPIMRLVMRTLAKIDADLYRKYVKEKEAYDQLSKDEQKQQEPPRHQRVRLEDTTVEAAQEVMKHSPNGVLCFQDELGGWFGSMDRYSGGSKHASGDRAFWLRAYNGGEYVYNRVQRGAVIIPNLSISVLGGIQPDVMVQVAASSVDDGLLQRGNPIMVHPATVGCDEPDDGSAQRFEELIYKLHSLGPPQYQGMDMTCYFDGGALEVREYLEQKHLDLQNCEAVNKKLAAHIGKYDGMFVRLCLLWHCIQNVDNGLPSVVSVNTARRVAEFMHQFLLPHAISFYCGVLGLSDDHDRLTDVAGYILAHELKQITVRDVQHGSRSMRRMTKRDIEPLFEQLEAFGWIWRTPGRRPSSSVWLVNPQVHVLFAERAKQEATRRQSAREAIAEALRSPGGPVS